MSFQLPSTLCSCQKVAYTIEIEKINTGQFEIQGPFYHNTMEPKLQVTQGIISAIFLRDNNYTMTVTMESFGEISTSTRYFFGKNCLFVFIIVLWIVLWMPSTLCSMPLLEKLHCDLISRYSVSQQSGQIDGIGNICF